MQTVCVCASVCRKQDVTACAPYLPGVHSANMECTVGWSSKTYDDTKQTVCVCVFTYVYVWMSGPQRVDDDDDNLCSNIVHIFYAICACAVHRSCIRLYYIHNKYSLY